MLKSQFVKLSGTALLAMSIGAFVADAQAPPPQAQVAPAQGPQPPAFPDFNSVVKGMQPLPGLVTFYEPNPADPQRDSAKLLAQIPRGLMNQDLLLASTISRGENAGFNWNDYLIRFEMEGKRVVITIPDTQYVRTQNTTAGELVGRTHTPGFLAAMPIVTMAPN